MTRSELVTSDQPPQPLATRNVYQVNDPIAVLDTARFEHMQRVATVMAQCSMIPEALYMEDRKALPIGAVIANCFLVVNQASRWGMDPFAVAQSVSVIKGKICYEGKLIAAVLDAKLGIRLIPEFEEQNGDAVAVTIYAYDRDGQGIVNPRNGNFLTVRGTLADWRTTGTNSPWLSAGNHRRMFAYRGAREWTRMHRPSLMLGVYTDDEMADLVEDTPRSITARVETRVAPVPPTARLISDAPSPRYPRNDEGDQTSKSVAEDQPIAATASESIPDKPSQDSARKPPVPPGAKPRKPEPGSFEGAVHALKNYGNLAATPEALGAVWDQHVEPYFESFEPHEQDELINIHRIRFSAIAGESEP